MICDPVLKVFCDICSEETIFTAIKHDKWWQWEWPDVAREAIAMGWRLDRDKIYCPRCAKRRAGLLPPGSGEDDGDEVSKKASSP